MSKTRSALYQLAKLLGDVNAIKCGKVGTRLLKGLAGKGTGQMFRRLFK